MTAPLLIAFGGLPGTGKTTVARALAERLGAVYLRIDTIEQALRDSGVGGAGGDVGPAGYVTAAALAAENLALGRLVVADAVSPVAATRDGWRDAARRGAAPMVAVELFCSDSSEHRRRVETRAADIPGLAPPSWNAVAARRYEPWGDADLRLDTAALDADAAVAAIERRLAEPERAGA